MDDRTIAILTALGVVCVLAVGIGVAVALAQRHALAVRSNALRALATAHGWRFIAKNRSHAKRWHGKPFTARGSARHIVTGTHRGREFSLFEYHYTTASYNGTTGVAQNHVFSVWAVELPHRVPNLLVEAEGALGGRVAEAFGFARGELGDAEFDESFKTICDDDGFAHAVLRPEVVSLLKGTGPWHWRFSGTTMLSYGHDTLGPTRALVRLEQMSELLDLVPDEVWSSPPARS